MKTPEEIKRDLIDYMEDASCVTEYGDAHDLIDSVEKGHATMADALAYIQQLEKDNAQKDERIRQLEREKTELMYACEQAGRCLLCKHIAKGTKDYPCRDCRYCDENLTDSYWEWRGVEEDEA